MGSATAPDREQKALIAQDGWPGWFEDDPRWQLAQRVVATGPFVRSRLLARFLLYIVAETLEDRKANITEHRIGVHVFERPPSYSSVEDNIVRTYARQLRRRLAEYFVGEGAAEPMRIDIPLGGYVPVFVSADTSRVGTEEPAHSGPIPITESTREKAHSSAHTAGRRVRRWVIAGVLLAAYSAILACVVWFLAIHNPVRHPVLHPDDPTRPLWTALFGGPENCYIVPADAGFNILEDFARHPQPLSYYLKGGYLTEPLPQLDVHSADDLRTQQFTSFVDLQTVMALARLPEFNPQRDILRFPRDLQLDDLKNSNAVLLGSMGSDPWAAIAESNANFRIVNSDNMQGAKILNLKPEPGEAASYVSHWNEPAHETFAVIAYLPNLGGSGHVLLLQGLDVAGTQAAAETIFHPTVIAHILQSALRSDGTLRPFEILLRSTSIESNATNTQVIGSRIY